jgi:hypothetical protein
MLSNYSLTVSQFCFFSQNYFAENQPYISYVEKGAFYMPLWANGAFIRLGLHSLNQKKETEQ